MTLFTVTSILVALSVASVSGLVIDDAFALHDDDDGDLWVGHPTLNHTFIPTLDVATNEFTFAFDMRTQLFRAAKVSLVSPGSSEVIPLSDSKVKKHDGYARYTLTLPDETVYRVLSWDSPGSFQTAKGAALNYNYDPDHPHVGQYSRSASSSYDVISTNPITPVVSISSATGGGTGGNVTFTLQANPAPSFPLPVIINVTTVGEYGITTGRQVTPIHENGFGTISLLIDDTTHNGNGSVTIQIDKGVGYTRGADVIKTVDVLDSQQPTVPSTLSNSTQSTPIQQDAILLDTVPPVITVPGKNPIIINLGTTYNDAGATCTDNVDTNPTLVQSSTVDASSRGSYTVTYTCTDDANNSAQAVRTVNVVTVPGAPTGLRAIAGDAQVELSWTAPSDTGGRAITDYKIEYKTSGGSWTVFNDGTSTRTSATVTGLTNDQAYHFRVSATNSIGTGAVSNTAQATPTGQQTPIVQPPPIVHDNTPPTIVHDNTPPTIVITDSNPITISLGTVYNDAGATCTDNVDTNPTLVQRSTVDASSRGSYTVTYTCIDDSNNEAQAVRTVNVVTVPGAPTGLRAIAGDGQVELSWRAPDNGGDAITDYIIQYSVNAGASWSTFNDGTSTSTSTTVTGLTNGNTYQFRTSAVNAQGTGSTSNVASITPTVTVQPVITALGAPTNLSAIAADGEITLSWTAPANDGNSPITSYTIQQSTNAGTTWVASTPSTSTGTTVIVTGLTNDQIYHFRVSAVNAQGTSPASNVDTATPTAPAQQSTAPGIPTDLSATIGNTQVTLSWAAPTNIGSSAIISYTIQQSTDGTAWVNSTPATATELTQIVTGLTNGVQYQFRVNATNTELTGDASAIISATPDASIPTVPDAPIYPSFWITDDATEVRLFWNAPADNGGSDITSYKPQYKIATDSDWTAGPTGLSIPATISGLTPNQPYEFRVFAVNDIGTSEPSLVTFATLVPIQATSVPSAPTNLQATAGNGITTLSWNAPSDGRSLITGYIVQQSIDGTTWTNSAFTISGTTATVTGLTNDIQYSFRVLATNAVGNSEPSNVDMTTPVAQQTKTAPDAPIYPSFWITDDATEVRLFWNAPADNGGSDITVYKTQYKIATDSDWTNGPDSTTIPVNIPNLTPNKPYEFRVFAVNDIGTSEPSLVTFATLVPIN